MPALYTQSSRVILTTIPRKSVALSSVYKDKQKALKNLPRSHYRWCGNMIPEPKLSVSITRHIFLWWFYISILNAKKYLTWICVFVEIFHIELLIFCSYISQNYILLVCGTSFNKKKILIAYLTLVSYISVFAPGTWNLCEEVGEQHIFSSIALHPKNIGCFVMVKIKII